MQLRIRFKLSIHETNTPFLGSGPKGDDVLHSHRRKKSKTITKAIQKHYIGADERTDGHSIPSHFVEINKMVICETVGGRTWPRKPMMRPRD